MKPPVVVSGEVLWDFFEVKPGVFVRHIGGSAANTAVALARLGEKVVLEGETGADAFGDELVRAIEHEGVEARLVRRPQRTGIVFVRDGRFFPYRSGPVRGTTRAVIAGREFFDMNARSHAKMSFSFTRAALVKASREDLLVAAGTERAGLAWLARHAPRAVLVVTRADGPASAFIGRKRIDVPARPMRGGESTGAGDAFMAGMLSVIAGAVDTWNTPEVLARALRIGHKLGARRITWRRTQKPAASPSARRAGAE